MGFPRWGGGGRIAKFLIKNPFTRAHVEELTGNREFTFVIKNPRLCSKIYYPTKFNFKGPDRSRDISLPSSLRGTRGHKVLIKNPCIRIQGKKKKKKLTIPQNFNFKRPEKSRDETGGIKILIKNIFTRAYDKKVTLLQNLILKALREPEIGLPLPEKEGHFI